MCLGRHTLSGLLTTNGQLDRDWSADYRLYSHARLEPAELFGVLRRGAQQNLAPDQALVVAMDDSILRKSGRTIPGVGYRRDPLSPPFHLNLVRGMRFVQLSALVQQQDEFCRMIPIDFQQAPLPKRPARNAPANQQDLYQAQLAAANINLVARERLAVLREQLDAEQDPQHPRQLHLVVDGRLPTRSYSNTFPTTPPSLVAFDGMPNYSSYRKSNPSRDGNVFMAKRLPRLKNSWLILRASSKPSKPKWASVVVSLE